MIVPKIRNEDLLKYQDITKHFDDLIFKRNTSKKIKIIYNNPDDFDKNFEIISTDNDTVFVRSKELRIESKRGNFIRLTLNIPSTICKYPVSIIVKNKDKNEVEEVLRFNIQVVA